MRIKARRHQDEVRVEVDQCGQHLVTPRAPPQQRVEAWAGDAHLYDAGACQDGVVCCAGRELVVGVLGDLWDAAEYG